MEEVVRLAPEQYWWLHRRWKEYGLTRLKRRRKAA
jgi:lauroyl/myristoyl acyltransferase